MRVKIIIFIFIVIWITLIVRVYYISIKSNTYYGELAKQNTIRTEKLTPVRGVILDRNQEPLAVNKLGFSINISPHLSSKSKIEILEREIKKIISLFPEFNIEKLKKSYIKKDSPYNHRPINIIEFISHKDMLPYYSKLKLEKHIEIKPATERFYPNRDIASHIIGYVSKANRKDIKTETTKLTGIVGKSGIEKYYNEFLEGEYGYRKIKITAFNEELEEIEKVDPLENNRLTLTIDLRVQKFIQNLFQEQSGVAIVMNAKNGEILSAGSFPEFDINAFVGGISQKEWNDLITDLKHPFTNKFINGLYPPGSVVKMGVALSFLESGIDEHSSVFCNGSMELGGRDFRCWKYRGHGKMDMVSAIRESCDDYFYKNSLKVGIKSISKTLTQLGFSQKSEIDLPNEWIGVVPNREWKMQKYQKPWYMGETLISSIGQGYFLVTPMQVAKYTALLATGKSITPHFIKNKNSKYIEYKPRDVLTPFQKSKLHILKEGMYQVSNHKKGTAYYYLRKTDIKVASKTGTAQVVGIPQEERRRMKEEDMEYYRRSHAWLTLYFPVKNPEYVVTLLIEHGGHGGSANGEIATKIVNKMVELGYVEEESE